MKTRTRSDRSGASQDPPASTGRSARLAPGRKAVARATASRTTQPRGDAVVEKILAGGMDAFLESGFEGTSVDVIAERTRTSKATIYRYFPDKEALFTAIVDRAIEERRRPVEVEPGRHANVRSLLIDYAEQCVKRQNSPERLRLCRVYMFEIQKFAVIEKLFSRFDDRDGEVFAANFVQIFGGRLRNLTDPQRDSMTFMQMVVHPFLYWALFRPRSYESASAAERRKDLEALIDKFLIVHPPA